jgi:hypothetical protein
MHVCSVPTISFGVIYCFVIIGHDRRRILHFADKGVIENECERGESLACFTRLGGARGRGQKGAQRVRADSAEFNQLVVEGLEN